MSAHGLAARYPTLAGAHCGMPRCSLVGTGLLPDSHCTITCWLKHVAARCQLSLLILKCGDPTMALVTIPLDR